MKTSPNWRSFKTIFFSSFVYASRENLYKLKVRTNSGKQTIAYMANVLWDSIPANSKDLNVFNFSKSLKLYLLPEQQSVT